MKSARHCWQFLFAPIFTRSVCNLRTTKKLDRETRITPTGRGAKSLTHLAWPRVGVYPRISPCLEALRTAKCESIVLQFASAYPARQLVERERSRSVHRSFPKIALVARC